MTHTPAPWSIEVELDEVDQIERKVIAVEDGRKHIAAICTWGGPDPEADANARLIALAPEMRDVIQDLADCAEAFVTLAMFRGRDLRTDAPKRLRNTIATARALLRRLADESSRP